MIFFFAVPGRLMVGLRPLEASVGVQILSRQPKNELYNILSIGEISEIIQKS